MMYIVYWSVVMVTDRTIGRDINSVVYIYINKLVALQNENVHTLCVYTALHYRV